MLEIRPSRRARAGPTISGPIEIISTPGSFCPSTAHSRPPWTTASAGSAPKSRAYVALRGRRAAPSRGRGSHGGYERAPRSRRRASRASACIVARTPSSAAAFELRVIDASVSDAVLGFGDGEARARLDDAGKARAHRDDARRDRREQVERSLASTRGRRRRRARAGAIVSARPSSEPAYCAQRSRRARRSAAPGTRFDVRPGRQRPRCASRGIAFRLTPPSSCASRNGAASIGRESTRPSALIAFDPPAGDVAARVTAPRAGELDAESDMVRAAPARGQLEPR